MAEVATSTSAQPIRVASVERVTNETSIIVQLALDVHPQQAPQKIDVKTGIGFLDHVSKRRGFGLERFAERGRGGDVWF